MKTRLIPLLLVLGWVAGGAAETAGAAPKFTWVALDDPAAAAIRRNGDEVIKRIGALLIYEVEHSLAAQGLLKTIEIVHLRDLELPKLPPDQPQIIAIRRTSLRLRNPGNQPDAADRAALEKINTALEEGDDVPPLLIQRVTPANAPEEWRAYRPITTMPQCLKCHGPTESLVPEIRAWLAQHYPADQATGYATYQWRGVIRVSFAASAAPAK